MDGVRFPVNHRPLQRSDVLFCLLNQFPQLDILRFQFRNFCLDRGLPDRDIGIQKLFDLLQVKAQLLVKPNKPDAFPLRLAVEQMPIFVFP